MARAMGGKERVLAIESLVLTGTGEAFNLGQNSAPTSPLPRYEVTKYSRTIDFAGRRWRQEVVREPRFITGNTAPQRLVTAIDGDVAFNILPNGTATRAGGRAPIDRAHEFAYHPIGFLQAAFTLGTQLAEVSIRDGLRYIVMNAAGNEFAILVDPQWNLPAAIEKTVYHPMLGDVVLSSEFSDWREFGGLLMPARIVQRLDSRYTLSDIRLTDVRINDVTDDLAAPAELISTPPPAPAINVTAEEIAPGIWYLAGQSHHSVAIEMSDQLVLVEAPQSDARTLAVIQRARELRPGKPVTTVINTHHHFDHSGGIRAAISEGLTVITHAASKAFFDSLALRRHSIVEDALAKAPRAVRVEGVADARILRDSTRSVAIHHIVGSPHAETLLMIYLPEARMLIEADVYTPPAEGTAPGPAPFAANLVENIDRLGLEVDFIVPIHGRVVPMSMLRATVPAQAAPSPDNL